MSRDRLGTYQNRVWHCAAASRPTICCHRCRPAPNRPCPPPLLKAYFRLGVRACGEPCYDPAFNCAGILVLVKVDEIDASYARHFLDRVMKG